ncbi:enoyl-CoA hydratase/isomerase family protein [Serinicoccus kebangsaanensis]|uniref:enoyl-CoA hydratase/isomerase family protein n=1 Tax=Serinicoccus kebangsaanensis TaxID=2602069 RepID=UPI00124C3AD4|nr:enoyl-CoA hydratase/isomerase family protein [Serinicoccus kebangsaanensis]
MDTDHVVPPLLTVEHAGAVATVTLRNPPLNILTSELKDLITTTFLDLSADEGVRAVVLTGGGDRAFSAGANLKEFPERIRLGNAYEVSKQGHRVSEAVRRCRCPVVAAVDGLALGGGLELALFADLRIAARRSTFALPEVRRGVFPGTSGSQLLPRIVGAAQAKRLMMFGDPIDADEALRIGLVDLVVDDGTATTQAQKWGGTLAERPAVAVRLIKRLVDTGATAPLEVGLEYESQLFARAFDTADAAEGAAAFLERREPDFRHE